MILAYDVPMPKGYHGGSGGELMIACLMFDQFLAADNFEAAPEGQWLDIMAGNLHCKQRACVRMSWRTPTEPDLGKHEYNCDHGAQGLTRIFFSVHRRLK